ncbi:MAG: type II toxin-antitoxin system VapC family toxin [Verrucomicrobia bacterium]|nr:type II toxin-antitoxin system VapC family toxin [Verrucomicrobiota bacterium]MDA1085963.1 type II toxin-antitoxin system VapC family toxin [Verrucomicrobiota bacterium]
MGCRRVIVLDTHAWVWYVDDPSQFAPKTLASIEASMAKGTVYVSSISIWEILMLESKSRLKFGVPADVWLDRCDATGLFNYVPVANAISRLAVSLGLHGDPADRFIAATAVYLGATLVTKDRRLRASRKITTLW